MPLCELDHLVVGAATLDDGVAWLEDKLGVTVPEGGKHPLMGTHNRLMQLGNGTFLEIIAIDPDAAPPGHRRWYGLDDPQIRERLAASPQLLTWVVRCDDIAVRAAASPISPGPAREARRGHLIWEITVPHDGSLPEGGLFPTLIQWTDGHGPALRMPDLGCRLEGLTLYHPEPDGLRSALASVGADGFVTVEPSGPEAQAGLAAVIGSPNGRIEIR